MERPKKYFAHELHPGTPVFKFGSINPLLDELERLKAEQSHSKNDKKPFTSYEEFEKWYIEMRGVSDFTPWLRPLYDYFAQFQYETKVFPKVGDMVEGDSFVHNFKDIRGKLVNFRVTTGTMDYELDSIRPITSPTREELIEMYKIKPEHLELLKG